MNDLDAQRAVESSGEKISPRLDVAVAWQSSPAAHEAGGRSSASGLDRRELLAEAILNHAELLQTMLRRYRDALSEWPQRFRVVPKRSILAGPPPT